MLHEMYAQGVRLIGELVPYSLGTGEYALHGDGRKGGWHYKDDDGKWHHTYGKTPTRALHNAFVTKKGAITNRFEAIMKEGMD